MPLLNRDQILGALDRSTVDIPVPEWGGDVRLMMLSGNGRDAFEQSSLAAGPDGKKVVTMDNIRAKLVAACAVDEDGNPLFTESDVAALGQKNGAALDRLFSEAQKLNKLRKEDIEELVGNSGAVRNGSSISA